MFGKKKPAPTVREVYNPSFFDDVRLLPASRDANILNNIMVLGEVARLDSNEHLDAIAATLTKIAETQAALLETQQAILAELRGEAAPARKPQRSFVPAGATPSL